MAGIPNDSCIKYDNHDNLSKNLLPARSKLALLSDLDTVYMEGSTLSMNTLFLELVRLFNYIIQKYRKLHKVNLDYPGDYSIKSESQYYALNIYLFE